MRNKYKLKCNILIYHKVIWSFILKSTALLILYCGPAISSEKDVSGSAPLPTTTDGSRSEGLANGKPARPDVPNSADEISPQNAVSVAERALLNELRIRRASLEAREAALTVREGALAAVERSLGVRIAELSALQSQIEESQRVRKETDELNWRKLAKTYEAMKPRDAATIFNELEISTLIPIIGRLKESKAGQILPLMVSDRAREVTTLLSGSRRNELMHGIVEKVR